MTMLRDILTIFFLAFTLLLLLTAMVSLFLGVPYVPSKRRVIDALLEYVPKKNNLKVYDLGCGNGKILFQLEKKKGIIGTGYELAPLVFMFAILQKWLRRSKVKLRYANFFHQNLSDADIILCYLTPGILEKLGKKLQNECKKGTLIISHTFKIPGLNPKHIQERDMAKKLPTLYIYEI
ncbi:class I SAM-dependent methyltransferase [Candidatus Peregrinibacteria bacterium]|nr:class I SAM-dependent methyltransferase [Candidatus Peregrinibacteria bacterium]